MEIHKYVKDFSDRSAMSFAGRCMYRGPRSDDTSSQEPPEPSYKVQVTRKKGGYSNADGGERAEHRKVLTAISYSKFNFDVNILLRSTSPPKRLRAHSDKRRNGRRAIAFASHHTVIEAINPDDSRAFIIVNLGPGSLLVKLDIRYRSEAVPLTFKPAANFSPNK